MKREYEFKVCYTTQTGLKHGSVWAENEGEAIMIAKKYYGRAYMSVYPARRVV